jgi:hypothetical protein
VGGQGNPAQREHGNLDAAASAFWRAIVGVPGDALTLPARRARPATLASDFASVKAAFGPRLAARVEALAAALAVPVPVAILTALEAFLCRYAAQREIGIGIGAALFAEFSRDNARVDALPLRAELAASSDIRSAVAKIADEIEHLGRSIGSRNHLEQVQIARRIEEVSAQKVLAEFRLEAV